MAIVDLSDYIDTLRPYHARARHEHQETQPAANDEPWQPWPEWKGARDIAKRPNPQAPSKNADLGAGLEDDFPENRANAARIIGAARAVPAHDEWTYRQVVWAFAYLESIGWTRAKALAATWAKTCPEKFDHDDFEETWNRYDGRITVGILFHIAKEHGWTPPEQEQGRTWTHSGALLVPVGELLSVPKPLPWLVKGIIQRESQVLVFGDPEAGKSLIAVDSSLSVATGRDWAGRKIEQGPVVYIAGEGHHGLRRRILAWGIEHDCVNEVRAAPLAISRMGLTLIDPKAVEELVSEVDALANQVGKPALIVVDTLHRNLGGDENSPVDMGAYFAATDRLRERYGATVVTVHHSGHVEKGRSRGSSAIRAAVDTEFQVTADKGGIREMIATKMKDAPKPPPLSFELKQVALPWMDADGNPETSVVLVPSNHSTAPQSKPLTNTQQLAVETWYQAMPRRLAAINGLPVSEHIGRSIHDVVPDLAGAVEKIFNQVIESGQPVQNFELSGVTPARPGVRRTGITHWFPLKDAEGRVVGVNVVAEETTERKKAEEALKKSHDTLERKILERTAELEATVAALENRNTGPQKSGKSASSVVPGVHGRRRSDCHRGSVRHHYRYEPGGGKRIRLAAP